MTAPFAAFKPAEADFQSVEFSERVEVYSVKNHSP